MKENVPRRNQRARMSIFMKPHRRPGAGEMPRPSRRCRDILLSNHLLARRAHQATLKISVYASYGHDNQAYGSDDQALHLIGGARRDRGIAIKSVNHRGDVSSRHYKIHSSYSLAHHESEGRGRGDGKCREARYHA